VTYDNKSGELYNKSRNTTVTLKRFEQKRFLADSRKKNICDIIKDNVHLYLTMTEVRDLNKDFYDSHISREKCMDEEITRNLKMKELIKKNLSQISRKDKEILQLRSELKARISENKYLKRKISKIEYINKTDSDSDSEPEKKETEPIAVKPVIVIKEKNKHSNSYILLQYERLKKYMLGSNTRLSVLLKNNDIEYLERNDAYNSWFNLKHKRLDLAHPDIKQPIKSDAEFLNLLKKF
jgi:hypothetical protein